LAVRLRLRRFGRKKQPFYRIVAADSRSPRDGRFIEELGYYNPLSDPMTLKVDEERIFYWLKVGAQPTKTVRNILSKLGIILKFDLQKRGLSDDQITEEMKKWEVLQLERARRLDAKKAQEEAEKKKAKEKAQAAAEVEAAESVETHDEPEKVSEAVAQDQEGVEITKPAKSEKEIKTESEKIEKSPVKKEVHKDKQKTEETEQKVAKEPKAKLKPDEEAQKTEEKAEEGPVKNEMPAANVGKKNSSEKK